VVLISSSNQGDHSLLTHVAWLTGWQVLKLMDLKTSL